MFRIPIPPETLVVRQLECVCCKEFFAIAEDAIDSNSGDNSHWRLPPDHYPNTQLRYEPDTTFQSVAPQARAQPDITVNYPGWSTDLTKMINCPRCGADNRNWLQIMASPPTRSGNSTAESWHNRPLRQLHMWRLRFAPALFGLVVAWALLPIAARRQVNSASTGRNFILLLAIALAGLIPAIYVPRRWKQLRDFRYRRAILPGKSIFDKVSPSFSPWLKSTAFFLVILPLFLYVLIPFAFDFLSSSLSPPPPPKPLTLQQRVERASNKIGEAIAENSAARTDQQEIISELQLILEPDETADEPTADTAVRILTEIAEAIEADNLDDVAIKQAENRIYALEKYIELAGISLSVTADTNQRSNIDIQYLRTWFLFVTTASFISLVFPTIAVTSYVGRINALLPRPIYFSLSNMTRVVVWEAKRTLEIMGNMRHVQWMNAQRNHLGGIDLEGLHRDLPDFGTEGHSISTRVQAQKLTIRSDMWGKIYNTSIVDVRVTPAVGAPKYSASNAWPTERSDSRHDEVTSEEPIPVFSDQLQRQPAPMLGRSASRIPADQSHFQTQPLYDTLTEFESVNRVTLTQIRHEICQKLNEVGFRRLCAYLDVDYERLLGDRMEDKAIELVKVMKRQRRLGQLRKLVREWR